MSRFVDKLTFYDRRSSPMEEAEDFARNGLLVHHRADGGVAVNPSQTLGQLFKRVGDASGVLGASGSPDHHDVDVELGPVPTRPNPFVLSFTDLTYSVKISSKLFRHTNRRTDPIDPVGAPSRVKTLLDGISGEAREGEILAVLGASGSGKSTLIDALANKIKKESLKGEITINGESIDSRLMKVISAYVMQDDLLYPMLTVEETLMFSAEFRLPRALSN